MFSFKHSTTTAVSDVTKPLLIAYSRCSGRLERNIVLSRMGSSGSPGISEASGRCRGCETALWAPYFVPNTPCMLVNLFGFVQIAACSDSTNQFLCVFAKSPSSISCIRLHILKKISHATISYSRWYCGWLCDQSRLSNHACLGLS